MNRSRARALVVSFAVALAAAGAQGSPASAGPRPPARGGSVADGGQPVPIKVRPNIPYGAGGTSHTMDAYIPIDGAAHPAVLVIHGGGWSRGDKADVQAEAEAVASQGAVVFAVNYRLAPEFPHPAAFDDVTQAVMFVRARAADFDVDPNRIGALGFSAGGHLASFLAAFTDGHPTSGAGIVAAAAWSGAYDLLTVAKEGEVEARMNVMREAGCEPGSQPTTPECSQALREASPMGYLSRGDAPFFFVHSVNEIIPVSQAERMDEALTSRRIEHTYIELEGARHARGYESARVPKTDRTVLQATLDFFDQSFDVVNEPAAPSGGRRARRLNDRPAPYLPLDRGLLSRILTKASPSVGGGWTTVVGFERDQGRKRT